MSKYSPFKKIVQYAIDEAEGEAHWLCGNALGDTEIEKVFFSALCMVVRYDYRSPFDLVQRMSNWTPVFEEEDQHTMFIQPQVPIASYRVDFLIHVWHFMGAELDEQGKFPYDPALWRKLVVECDGHDFHERTKEQAARDRARDRYLTSEGYTVFRFTGSELWRDPIKCATEIMDWCCK